MGLAHIQRGLAELFTNAHIRERFFADPHAIGELWGLSPDEGRQLAQLAAQQLHVFASSLQHKRLAEVRTCLPLTQRVLGKRFASLFRRYADTHLPRGIKKHRDDALAFAAFIEQVGCTEGVEPCWAVELARYEAACLTAADPTCRWVVRCFRHPLASVVWALAHGDDLPTPPIQPTLAVWVRLPKRGRLRHVVLTLPRLL